MANNETIKADGSAAPVEQTYGETWTSQLFVLGDFHNVAAAVPDLRRGVHRQQGQVRDHAGGARRIREHPEGQDAGYFNKDFASAKLNDGIKAVATGTAAHYPQLGGVAEEHRERRSREVKGRRLLRPAR